MPTIDRRRWERPNAEPRLTHAEAQLMLRRYAADARLVHHIRLADGLANGAWRLEWRSAARHHCAVLRVSARDHIAFAREARLLGWLASRCDAPAPLHIEPAAGDQPPWTLLPWRPGIPLGTWLQHTRPAVGALAERVAEHLAGRLALPTPSALGLPEYPAASMADLILESLDHPLVSARLAPQLRGRLLRELERRSASLVTQASLEGLVHGDFSGSNLLIEEAPRGPRLGAVVDWEFAHRGSALVDLGHLLRVPALRDRAFTERFSAAMAAQGRPLAPGWIEAATLVDILAWLYFLSRPPERPRLFADCRARLEEILALLGAAR